MRLATILLFLSLSFPVLSQSTLADTYLSAYKNIAIQEMHRTGIPASITLAQGLLESNWGRSELATKSNNHFGIKCGNAWDGKTHYRYDDDYDENGKHRKSCFRVYEHAEASFIDHSDFLTDPAKAHRYGFLFEFHPEDYHAWAHGLKKAGYATDPKYGHKLIQIIDKYDLHQFDLVQDQDEIYALQPSTESYSIDYINSCKIVRVREGDKLKDLAGKLGISYRKVLRYNPTISSKNEILEPGQVIYLESRRNYYLGNESVHKVKSGEDLVSISNLYGIDQDYLTEINNLYENQKLQPGQQIKLVRQANQSFTEKSVVRDKKPNRELVVDHSDYLFDHALSPIKQ